MNADLEWISDSSHLSIESENRQLTAYSRYGAWGNMMEYYEFQNERLVMVKSVETFYEFEEDEENKNVLHTSREHIIVSESIDGEMVVTEDYYVER